MKLASFDRQCREIEHGGRLLKAKDGIFDVPDSAVRALKATGLHELNMLGHGLKAKGYRCTKCGFGSFFKRCSRCQGEAVREVADGV